MAEDITLYTNPMSRGRIARWMLEEVGVPYRTDIRDFHNMKSPDYLAINPMGKVPVIRHGDRVVTECAAICAYLADVFPKAAMAPSPENRADYYRWMFFGAGPLEAAVTNKALGFQVPPERQRMCGYGSLAAVLDALEGAVSASPYIAGDHFSAADVYVGSQIAWGLTFGTIEKRAAFADYVARITGRDGYRRASALDDAALPAEKN